MFSDQLLMYVRDTLLVARVTLLDANVTLQDACVTLQDACLRLQDERSCCLRVCLNIRRACPVVVCYHVVVVCRLARWARRRRWSGAPCTCAACSWRASRCCAPRCGTRCGTAPRSACAPRRAGSRRSTRTTPASGNYTYTYRYH